MLKTQPFEACLCRIAELQPKKLGRTFLVATVSSSPIEVAQSNGGMPHAISTSHMSG
jgi:hypothetical protein